jgi:hypothetical protein
MRTTRPTTDLRPPGNTLCSPCSPSIQTSPDPMSAAVVIGLIVVAIVAGTAISLRSTARTGMPSKEVLDRAKQRSRELEAGEKAEQPDRSD